MKSNETKAGVSPVLSTAGLADWPRDPANGRYLCSPEKPMPKDAPGQWAHTGTTWVKESYDCCSDKYRCTDCGEEWWSTCPD